MQKGNIQEGNIQEGMQRIEWAERHMPVLMRIRETFERTCPLRDVRIGACLHVTKETAVLVRTLVAGGAKVALCASNPLSTQDDVASALSDEVEVHAWRGQTTEEYWDCIDRVLSREPQITLDDGCDMTVRLHEHTAQTPWGGTEETTTGVNRLKALESDGKLRYPMVAVNDTPTKRLFDNRYGTGQSAIDGILRSTSILLAGKTVVVCGYGWCGRGVAMRARGMGARVIVTEVDPTKALEAAMDGYRVMPIEEAASHGDVFVTTTGNIHAIGEEAINALKDGAILSNAGHFDVEIDVPYLRSIARGQREARPNVTQFELADGRTLYLLAQGRLVNLACAEGHPPEVMDMSFADQALSAEWLVSHHQELKPIVYPVPQVIDKEVARLKLASMGLQIDELTPEQLDYLRKY